MIINSEEHYIELAQKVLLLLDNDADLRDMPASEWTIILSFAIFQIGAECANEMRREV